MFSVTNVGHTINRMACILVSITSLLTFCAGVSCATAKHVLPGLPLVN